MRSPSWYVFNLVVLTLRTDQLRIIPPNLLPDHKGLWQVSCETVPHSRHAGARIFGIMGAISFQHA
jgi:hypothetical protein